MTQTGPFDFTAQDDAHGAHAVEADRLAKLEIDDFCWFMSDKRGRRILWRLLESSGVFRSSHTGNALQTAFLEGQRSLGLQQFAMATRHAPALYARMAQENSR